MRHLPQAPCMISQCACGSVQCNACFSNLGTATCRHGMLPARWPYLLLNKHAAHIPRPCQGVCHSLCPEAARHMQLAPPYLQVRHTMPCTSCGSDMQCLAHPEGQTYDASHIQQVRHTMPYTSCGSGCGSDIQCLTHPVVTTYNALYILRVRLQVRLTVPYTSCSYYIHCLAHPAGQTYNASLDA